MARLSMQLASLQTIDLTALALELQKAYMASLPSVISAFQKAGVPPSRLCFFENSMPPAAVANALVPPVPATPGVPIDEPHDIASATAPLPPSSPLDPLFHAPFEPFFIRPPPPLLDPALDEVRAHRRAQTRALYLTLSTVAL